MEETLCIVKPDAVNGGLTERILTAAEQSGFYVVRQAEKRLTPARAREFYRHLDGTPQFRVVAEFMSSGPVVVAVLSKVDAVNAWRELIGPTDPNVARETSPGSLRAQLGVDALRNVVHGSASVQDAAREKGFMFPQGPLPSLIPKEYLLETLVMPGLVEALGELYLAQPADPYEWMSHWFHTNFPPGRDVNEDWPEPALGPTDVLEEAVGHMCHRRILGAPLYDSTWNFRRCKDRDPVYGMGMSETNGARTVADGLYRSGHRQIAWVFLADEPTVYLGSSPVTPVAAVDEGEPGGGGPAAEERLGGDFGRDHLDLERMERRLKADVSVIAGDGGRASVRVSLQPDEHGRRIYKERDLPDERALTTVNELFTQMNAEGMPVHYTRVPVGQDSAPSERGFEALLEACLRFDLTAAMVFTCRDGVTRTTVGMVVGCVVWQVRNGELPEFLSQPDPAHPKYDNAEFKPVMRIVTQLGQLGLQAKQVLDDAIDKCNVLVDVRRVMNRCRMAANGADTDAAAAARKKDPPATIAHRGLRCMERYCWLLLFTAYCIEQAPVDFTQRFSAWVRMHWKLRPKPQEMVLR